MMWLSFNGIQGVELGRRTVRIFRKGCGFSGDSESIPAVGSGWVTGGSLISP